MAPPMRSGTALTSARSFPVVYMCVHIETILAKRPDARAALHEIYMCKECFLAIIYRVCQNDRVSEEES